MQNLNEHINRMRQLIGAKHGVIKPLISEQDNNPLAFSTDPNNMDYAGFNKSSEPDADEQTTGTTINGCPSFNSDWYKNVYDMGFTTMGYQWEPVLSKKMGSSKESICSCFKKNPNYGENSDEYYDMCA